MHSGDENIVAPSITTVRQNHASFGGAGLASISTHRLSTQKPPFLPCNVPYGRTPFPELERQPTNSTRMNYDLSASSQCQYS